MGAGSGAFSARREACRVRYDSMAEPAAGFLMLSHGAGSIPRGIGGPQLSAAKARNSRLLVASLRKLPPECGSQKRVCRTVRRRSRRRAAAVPWRKTATRALVASLRKLSPECGSQKRVCRTTRRRRRRQPAAAPWRKTATRALVAGSSARLRVGRNSSDS